MAATTNTNGTTSFFMQAAATLYNALPSPSQQTGMFLDPVDVITGLAILSLYEKQGHEKGIKLSILENRVRRDHPGPLSTGLLQNIKRAYQGSKDEQLTDLITPIFYSFTWFDTQSDPEVRTLFQLAKEGMDSLRETYVREDKVVIVQLLTNCHCRLFKDGLGQNLTDIDSYGAENWDSNPYAIESKTLWKQTYPDRLRDISRIFRGALKIDSTDLQDDYDVKILSNLVKDRVDKVVAPLLAGIQKPQVIDVQLAYRDDPV